VPCAVCALVAQAAAWNDHSGFVSALAALSLSVAANGVGRVGVMRRAAIQRLPPPQTVNVGAGGDTGTGKM
jgi:hypothetical protein